MPRATRAPCTFGSSDGQAVLPAPDYTFAGADEGVHAFTNGVILKTGRRRQPNCNCQRFGEQSQQYRLGKRQLGGG